MSSKRTTESAPMQKPMKSEAIERFLREPNVAVLSWLTPKGEVASSPVWYEYRDGKFYVVTSTAFLKLRSMRKNPAVSLCVQDTAPPYRYVTFRARAEVHADPAAARALDARLARRYLGRTGGRYYTESIAQNYPGEPRIVEITPTHTSSLDGNAGLSPFLLMAMRAVRALGF